MPFLLLRLPNVARTEVFKKLDPLEILRLSQCSKRAQCLIKLSRVTCTFGIRRNTSLELDLSSGSIWLSTTQRSSDAVPEKSEVWKLGSKNAVVYTESPNVLKLEFENREEDVETVISYLVGVFKVKWVSFQNNILNESDINCRLLDHIMVYHGLKIRYLDWITRDNSDEVVQKALTAAIKASDFQLNSMVDEKIIHFNRFHEYTLDRLRIIGSNWITVDNLCELLNCLEVRFQFATFTSQDIGILLKYWIKNGGKIEKWMISSDKITGESIAREMQVLNATVIKANTWKIQKPEGGPRLVITYYKDTVHLTVRK